jgi:hypothetical protein
MSALQSPQANTVKATKHWMYDLINILGGVTLLPVLPLEAYA